MLQQYRPGFAMHAIHARQIATTPWGWRPAVITSAEGGVGIADYLSEEGTVTFWHHKPLDVEVGTPVRVHEEHHALEIVDAWLNVRVDAGIGVVPEPSVPQLWDGEVCGVIINAATGDGIRIDPEVARRLRHRGR